MYYGAVESRSSMFPSRITKLLDAEGRLILEYVDDVSVSGHPMEVLEDCQKIFGD